MRIELFSEHQGVKKGTADVWYWRAVERGKTTAMSGTFDDGMRAMRAARAHVRGCVRPCYPTLMVKFTPMEWDAKRRCWYITWAGY